MHKFNFAYYFLFASFLLLKIEGIKSQDCVQASFVQDFGADGISGPYNVTIANALRPGAVISVVTKSDIRGNVNLIADDIYVLHVDARIEKDLLVINTSKRLHVEWHSSEVRLPNPVVQGAKTTTTLVYEEKGYHIFINGKKIAFYEHRTDRAPQVLNLQHDFIYKILYLTTTDSSFW